MNNTTTKLDDIYDAILDSAGDLSGRSIAKSRIRALIYDTFNQCMQESDNFQEVSHLFLERVQDL